MMKLSQKYYKKDLKIRFLCVIIYSVFKCYDEVGVTYRCIPESTALAVSGICAWSIAFPFGAYPVKSLVAGYGRHRYPSSKCWLCQPKFRWYRGMLCIPSYLGRDAFYFIENYKRKDNKYERQAFRDQRAGALQHWRARLGSRTNQNQVPWQKG